MNARLRCPYRLGLILGVLSLLAPGGLARAGMILTPAGIADNLTLTTFASGFSNRGDGLGPIGIGYPSNGGVLVSVEGANASLVYAFPSHADNQSAASVTPVTYNSGNSVGGIAQIGSTLYMAQSNLNQIIQINNDGTFNHVLTSLNNPVAFAANPVPGHLFVSLFQGGIWDLNTLTGTATEFSTHNVDGLTYDPSTNRLYAADNFASKIIGFDVGTGTQVFDSGFIAGDPDGTAVGFGSLAGNLFVNTNGGTVVEINLATSAQTVIASGGSRGDLISVDPSNNSLLLTQSDSVLRLTAPLGSGFGPSATPEPSSLTLAGMGLLCGLGFWRRSGKQPK